MKRSDSSHTGADDLGRLDAEVGGNGLVVPLFADLERHDMGPRLAETFEAGGGHIPDEPNEDLLPLQ